MTEGHVHANGELCGRMHSHDQGRPPTITNAGGPAGTSNVGRGGMPERPSTTHMAQSDASQMALGESDAEQAAREEREALGKIAHAFRGYKTDADWEVTRWESNYLRLTQRHKRLVRKQPAKLKAAREAIQSNHLFFKSMLGSFDDDGRTPEHLSVANAAASEWGQAHPEVHPGDIEKVRYVLKNLMRDWSADGAPERTQSYGRIIKELSKRYEGWQDPQHPPRVLVPGAGLGRLCLEVASLGLEAQGNEFSYYMLLASSFVLNQSARAGQWTVFPWLHTNCNQRCIGDQLRGVSVPDVLPADMLRQPGLLSMCAGDFVEVYKAPEHAGDFDCVATCFFIDTAHNILEYMDVIWHVLKEGGLWINLGPLLYHWADAHTYLPEGELSIELSLEEVEAAAAQIGFTTLHREIVPSAYMANLKSMLKSSYNCAFWTMTKPAAA